MSRYRALSVALLTLGVSGCGTEVASTQTADLEAVESIPRELTVVVQSNVHGDIEPCG
jgi:hypothetical protein